MDHKQGVPMKKTVDRRVKDQNGESSTSQKDKKETGSFHILNFEQYCMKDVIKRHVKEERIK